MTSSLWDERQWDFIFHLKLPLTHSVSLAYNILPISAWWYKCRHAQTHIYPRSMKHMNTQPHVHMVMSEWQMKGVNCLSLTSSLAAGGYECMSYREEEEINLSAISLSEALSHLSFAPCFHSCHISLFCNIAPHLFVSWSSNVSIFFWKKKEKRTLVYTEKGVVEKNLSIKQGGWLTHLPP